jgi:Putative beta-barrel porin-2, OmpL-like. bbp2
VNRRRTARAANGIRLIAGVALISLLCNASAWAETTKKHRRTYVTTTTASTVVASASEQQRLNALAGQVTNLQKQSDDTVSEVKKIEAAITVAPPATADAKPVTVGEHVGVLEKSFGDLKTDLATNLGVHIHGLVDAGYEHNFNQPNGNTNLYRAWDEDGFQLTQGNIHIDRTVDGGVGFVTDLNFGQVANSISSVTNYSNVSHVGGQWFDPTQYYLTYTIPVGSGIAMQAGRFVTLLGAEVIPTYSNLNFNESRGLLFNLGEPLTHTGIRGSYTFNDYVAFTGGFNNGWDDPAAFNNGGPNGEGELSINNKEKTVALIVNGIWGSNLPNKSNSDLGAIDPILTWKPWFVPNLTLQGEYLYATESGPVINGHSATWQGAAGYLVYDYNEWESATRGEFFDDEDGARSGAAQTLWEITQTFSYKVPQVTGLLARLEYRHDNSSSHVFPNNNFVDPTTGLQHLWHGQDTLAANVIYSF